MSADLERLAAAVLARREELDLTQKAVYADGGPSDTTLSKIEAGTHPVSPSTLRKLDKGLQWERGSARRIFKGEGDAVPLGSEPAVPHNAGMTYSPGDGKPENISDEEYQRILRETDEFYRFKLQQAAGGGAG